MSATMNSSWRLVESDTGRVVVERLEIAAGYWSRLVGLQFRSAPPRGSGMLLVPCSSIHTFFVRFALDAVMLDRNGLVLAVRRGVRPWRIVPPTRGTYAILEVPSESGLDVDVSQSLRLEPLAGGGSRLPTRLTAWVVKPSV